MRVLVCGSRDWTDEETVAQALSRFPAGSTTIIHGAARGADAIAEEVALSFQFYVEEYPADWERHGRSAGFKRNLEMLSADPDLVLAFQREGSRGTQYTIEQARKRGIPVEVFTA